MNFSGCLTVFVWGSSEEWWAQTQSFCQLGGWYSSKGDSFVNKTRLQSSTVQLRLAMANSGLLCFCDSVNFGWRRGLMGFSFRDILRYRWVVDLETRWPLAVSLLASFLVDWPLFTIDLAITIFATRLTELFLPRPGLFSSVSLPLSRDNQRQN